MSNANTNPVLRDGAQVEQYLTFQLAGQEYGVDILRVQEIKGWDKPTRIPHSPAHVLGVINLRGAVVPVIDLRTRFGMEATAYGPTTVVIVARVKTDRGDLTAGVVVDAVCEVCNVTAENVRPAPDVGSTVDADSVKGLAMLEDRMLILLNIDRLVNASLIDTVLEQKVA